MKKRKVLDSDSEEEEKQLHVTPSKSRVEDAMTPV